MKVRVAIKYFPLLFFLSVGLLLGLLITSPSSATAVSGSDWRADRIIDDSVFFNPNTMTVQEIQNFLNAKVPSCDTNGDITIYDSTYGDTVTRKVYSERRGVSTPFICLKSYSQDIPGMSPDSYCGGSVNAGTKSAAQIIKDVAAACNINPKIMLVLLQKEQSLITDTWPWPIQYQKATGFACPDTSPCDPNYAGFFKQVYYGARQYQRYAKQPGAYNFKAGQTSNILYNPNTACGGTNVTIQNQATAGLYNYTPYQPNQAALNNLYGTGDSCSAYGNRNFWRMFWDWFGSPIGSEYAWLIESFNYSGGDNLIARGQTETLTLRARNVGRVPWYNHGDHPVRLGTWSPPNRTSPLHSSGWLSSARLANMTESSVAPNEIGTFTFQITGQKEGTYIEALNLVAENYTWLSWPGFSPTIQITNPYQWQIDDIIYDKGTGVMNPGTTQLITLKARNTGNVTWSKSGGAPIRLGTWEPGRVSSVGSGWLSTTRAVDMNENTVAPGQVAGFQFYVKMPSGGNYYERMNLVAEGQTWFNDPSLTLYLHGNTYSWQPLWHVHSTATANIPRNTEFTMTIKVKNTGEMAWKKTDPFPVRLGTVNPLNRGSAFYQSSWIRDTRPATHIEDTVLPGQEGTFTFIMKTPNTPGPWHEYFSLVAEGVQWFNNPGFNIYVNVVP